MKKVMPLISLITALSLLFIACNSAIETVVVIETTVIEEQVAKT